MTPNQRQAIIDAGRDSWYIGASVTESMYSAAAIAGVTLSDSAMGEIMVSLHNLMKEEDSCPCGSGLAPWDLCDARGIYVAKVCDDCEDSKRKGYRDDIFTDSNYWASEQIESDW